jgi:hypothetical protein
LEGGDQVPGRSLESPPARIDQGLCPKSHWRHLVGRGEKVTKSAAVT